jgi:hypothetical protein
LRDASLPPLVAHLVAPGRQTTLDDEDVHDVPTQRRGIALGIVILLVLAASLAWFTGVLT